MSQIEPAAKSLDAAGKFASSDYLHRLERASVVTTLNNLLTFEEIRKRVEDKSLQLVGAYFDVATGDLMVYDEAAGDFALVHDVMKRPVARI